ncbi:MAG: hypothetical protein HPY59_16330 [Anaerolineae bacterium]|nr:hypothetical protein [Anaerolineae bacterium]
MDPKFVGLVKMLQDSKNSFFISCIVQGILITGFVITEQKYFVETNRIMNDELKTISEARTHWEEIMLKLAKLPIENAALHLAGVKMYLPTGIQNFPTLRIDPSQVSAWTFLVPSNQDSYEYLPQILGEKPEDVG